MTSGWARRVARSTTRPFSPRLIISGASGGGGSGAPGRLNCASGTAGMPSDWAAAAAGSPPRTMAASSATGYPADARGGATSLPKSID